MQRLGVPDLVARVLAGRRVTLEQAAAFLDPKLRDQLPDPSRFRDMDPAVERLVRAVRLGESIAVFADYDVDGATSAVGPCSIESSASTMMRASSGVKVRGRQPSSREAFDASPINESTSVGRR